MSDPELTQTLLDWTAAFMRRSMADFMRFTRREGLSMVQINVLMRIYYHGDCDISTLLESLQVSKAAAGQLVERMEQQGLVERRANPQDRRARSLSLTARGRTMVEESIAARQAWMADLIDRIDPEERAATIKALRGLTAAAENLERK